MTDKVLKLCIGSLYFAPAYAGPAVRFQRYVPMFQGRGMDIQVFSSTLSTQKTDSPAESVSSRDKKDANGLITECIDDYPVHRVPLANNGALMRNKYGWALVQYCRNPRNRPDIIQLLSVSEWDFPWLQSLHRMHIPLVFTHTMLGELSMIPLKRALQRLYWPLRFRVVDSVVVSSSVMREALHNIGVKTRVEVITNGLDLNRFCPPASPTKRDELRQKLGLPHDAEIILFIGSLSRRKGLDILAKAWKHLAQSRTKAFLIFVGPEYGQIRPGSAESAFSNEIRCLIQESNAESRVMFAGAVNNVEEYLQSADVFVFPSRREGMPNVVLEAFGCGLPSVLTPFVGLPEEFGEPGEQYMLVESTPEALAEAINQLLDHDERRQQLGINARSWAEQHMSVEKSVDDYRALYTELIHQYHQ